MASLTITQRTNEGDTEQPALLWDSIWHPSEGIADWALADPDEKQNVGGLRAKGALHTAVIIQLFTDKYCPTDHPLSYLLDGSDRRGWFGDGEDIDEALGERPMGSLLYLLERAPLNEEIRQWAEAEALIALQTFIFQRVAVRIEATAVAYFAIGKMELFIRMYGRDGSLVYDQRFDIVWKQTATTPKPLPFPDFPVR